MISSFVDYLPGFPYLADSHPSGGKIPDYTDVLVVREIDCGNWLAREYMPAHQHCGLLNPLDRGLDRSPSNTGRPLILRSGAVSGVLSGH